ncbi:MAG: aminomethyltransferase family protein [Pseudomonadota bacterium]
MYCFFILWQHHNAYFGQFYSWERPLYFNKKERPALTMGRPAWFEQVGREVNAAHTNAALFDSSTFGKISVDGPDAERFLNRLCANNMACEPGRAIYTAILNQRGGYESDLTALRLTDESYRLYTGSAAIKRDIAWLCRHLDDERVTITDVTEDHNVFALMGPHAASIAASLGAENLNELRFFRHTNVTLAGINVRATRLSYVGEPGWEITCNSKQASTLCQHLIDAGAQPAGVFAQTAMRIEKRFLAYGHDLDTDTTPANAGLLRTVDFDTDFIGHDALIKQQQQPLRTWITTLLLNNPDAVPLGSEPVYFDGNIIGQSTSAAFGYRIGKPLAIVTVNHAETIARLQQGETLPASLDIAGEQFDAKLLNGPAYS